MTLKVGLLDKLTC